MTDFHSLYERYAPDVHRFALFLCREPAVADDITSETFVRAWTASGEIREATVKSYLFVIARNLYRDYLRRERRHTELDQALPDEGAGLHKQVEHRLELNRVMKAVRALPQLDQAALMMRAQKQMSYREIAGVLGLSTAAVKVRVFRARLKLSETR